MRRLAYFALLLSGIAAANPSYPLKLPKLDAKAIAAREAAFRKHNREHLTKVVLDERGFVRHVETDDPTLVPSGKDWTDEDVARVTAFLKRNAAAYGIDAAAIAQLASTRRKGDSHLLLTEIEGNALVGEINVYHYGNKLLNIDALFYVRAKPTVTVDDVRDRVIGKSYRVATGWGDPAPLDCAMTPLGAAGCKTAVQQWTSETVEATDRNVRGTSYLHADGAEVRLVDCIELESAPAPPKKGLVANERTFTQADHGPDLPLVVDAVTGKALAIHVNSCVQLANVR